MAKKPAKTAPAPTDQDLGPLRLLEDDTGHRFLVHVSARGIEHNLLFDGDQPWFTQRQLAEMFDVDLKTANHHVQEFLASGELSAATIRNFRIVQKEGTRDVERDMKHYALDVAF